MKIGILGTGMVGRAFAARFSSLGHDIVLGTRDVKKTLARTESDFKGTVAYAQWADRHPGISLNSFAEACERSELVINATAGSQTLMALEASGSENLIDKVILDLALPLDYSQGRPPYLAFANDDSLGEQIQRTLPRSRVVKALNTMSMTIMLNPKLLPSKHNVFMSGDDEGAKSVVKSLLGDLGWEADSIIDLGDIRTARSTEMYANLLFRIAKTMGTYDFNIALVRHEQ